MADAFRRKPRGDAAQTLRGRLADRKLLARQRAYEGAAMKREFDHAFGG